MARLRLRQSSRRKCRRETSAVLRFGRTGQADRMLGLAASIPGLALASEPERTRLSAVVVDATLRVGQHARQRLRAIVVDTTLGVSRHARQALAMVVVGTPAAALPPFIA